MGWSWRLEDADGSAIRPAELPEESFGSQADAETWVGEIWRELLDLGVEQVTLLDGNREVYGPMGLRPPA